MNVFWNSFETLIGLSVEPKDLTFVQISLRGIIVFLATLIMIRLGHKRLLTRRTPFDAILLVILAAVLSRAINGSAAFFATLGGGVVLVLLHRLFAIWHTTRMDSAFWSKVAPTPLCEMANATFR